MVRTRQVRAFSLLEVLVSITVVVILGMLILPSFLSVQGSSAAVRCATNLRNVMIASLAWTTDNDGFLPDRTYWSVILRGSSTDPWSIFPYLGIPEGNRDEDSVLTCPELRNKYEIGQPRSVVSAWHRTYGINMYTIGSISGSRRVEEQSSLEFSYMKLSAIPFDLSKVAFFFDGPITIVSANEANFHQVFQYPELRDAAVGVKGTDYIHSGAINVVFLDGHVKRISREQNLKENLTDRSKPIWGRKP